MKKLIATLILLTGLFSNAQTQGTLTFTFTCPKHTTGNYVTDGRYVIAVWIESCTPCGTTAGTSTFVKTKLRRWGSGTNDHLPTWVTKSAQNVTDATTGATTTTFTSQTVTWNGTNTAGTVVADGSYRVCVQETWGHGTANTQTRYFPFTKGTAVDSQSPTADTHMTALSLVWQPALGNETFTQKGPDSVVYPNPSTGVFNVEITEGQTVNSIQVLNILGEVVYTKQISTGLENNTLAIDLSSMNEGIYLVNVTNDTGTSTHKLYLKK